MEGSTKQNSFEVLKTPEISVNEERGAQLLSFILKAKNPEWGNSGSKFTQETIEYFAQNPLDPKISGFLDEIQALQENGVDEEVLYNLALTYKHPERNDRVFDMIKKHKEYVGHIIDPQELQQKLFHALETFNQSFSFSPLAEKLAIEIEKDKEKRQDPKSLEETEGRIEGLIDFFKPDSKTTETRRISLIPTDPLYDKKSGHAFGFGKELVLRSHIENPDGLNHEFLHSVINPIVEKLSQKLIERQKEKISQMASDELKFNQNYGEGYFSLLCEEFIRAYNDFFRRGENPSTYTHEDFQREIADKKEKQFQEALAEEERLRVWCDKLGIKTLEDFRTKSKEYFEQFMKNRFEKNLLQDLIFKFYQEYVNRPDKNVNFEQFVLNNFANKI